MVICNGREPAAIGKILQGKSVGTFFTHAKSTNTPVELEAVGGESMILDYVSSVITISNASCRSLQSLYLSGEITALEIAVCL